MGESVGKTGERLGKLRRVCKSCVGDLWDLIVGTC